VRNRSDVTVRSTNVTADDPLVLTTALAAGDDDGVSRPNVLTAVRPTI
jgi:hypothetical protein